jgi:DNA-binding beta-propeller fold protein YncE
MHVRAVAALWAALGLAGSTPGPADATFVTFETGHVRPLALSPDGSRLFAVNTPDDRLEIFAVGSGSLTPVASVPVGLEPCAVAARSDGEVWVVNHLSDSVSIVDVSATPPRVVRTLLVGDEPRDVVFASDRAFVTTAHRGQNSPVDPQLTTEGVGRADVWVFDPDVLGSTLGGTPLTILTLFGDTPRALAASADGTTVYAAVFHSGNRTTALSEGLVCNGGAGAGSCNVNGSIMPGGLPAPNTNFAGTPGPETGLIVRFDEASGQWRDQLARNWNNGVRFSLPDLDVFEIDADALLPAATASFAQVGTVLFNMAVNPVSGKVYVANTEARNEVRFEGPGVFGGTTVQGHLHETRITVLDGATVTPRHLNKHIDYDVRPASTATQSDSLSIPLGMAVSSDGATLYLAAFGSGVVGVFDTAELETDTFVPDAGDHIAVTGGGPSGVVLDEARSQLYVATRFDNGISIASTTSGQEVAHVTFFNPEPPHVQAGRPVLYDAVATTSNGESPCASCHVFGDFDSLAWDLGNPDDVVLNNPNPILLPGVNPDFHPLKGPMTTQSLRGMAKHGPMHWRGDRTAGNDPGGDPLDEKGAFERFIVAFEGLLGRNGPISAASMDAFADFILEVTYPPNPIRALDNSLTPSQQAGRDLYFGRITDVVFNCNGCHTLDPAQGFFGGAGQTTFENEPQMLKVPHLRNLYQKVGMFGMPAVAFVESGDNADKGPQVRGFGFLHDGTIDTLFRFHGATVFSLTLNEQRDLEAFMHAFDSNLAPIVGQQITIGPGSPLTVGLRIDLLLARADADECEVVVKGTLDGAARGWLRLANATFQSDRASEAPITESALRAQAGTAAQELTYTCVPPGSGERIGLDRDGDTFYDRTEIDAGSDPADPLSLPGGATTTTTVSSTSTTTLFSIVPIRTKALRMTAQETGTTSLRFRSATKGDLTSNRIVPAPRGGAGDPTLQDAVLTVYNSSGQTSEARGHTLAASGWSYLGSAGKPKGYRFSGGGATPLKVKLKRDLLAVRGRTLFSLDEVSQGRIAIRLDLGPTIYCAEVSPKSPAAANDKVGKFVGRRRTPGPSPCPSLP